MIRGTLSLVVIVACGSSEPPPHGLQSATLASAAMPNDAGQSHSNDHPIPMGSTMKVNGRLAPEIIKRVIQQNIARLESCYAQDLAAHPAATSYVTTKFVIDRSGDVSTATAEADPAMIPKGDTDCVAAALTALKFPRPEGGIVSVVYLLSLAPADP